jgi:sugar phosphate isomerase/epimerase
MQSPKTTATQASSLELNLTTPSFPLSAASAASRHGLSRRELIGSTLAATAGALLSRASQTPRWQIGCYTRPWAQLDYHVAFDGIAAAGFGYVGLMTTKSKTSLIISMATTPKEAAAIGREAKQRGLTIISMWADDAAMGVTGGLKHLIDNSAACGCPYLLLGGTEERHAEAYYKTVAECCDYAASKAVVLTLKPHAGSNPSGASCRQTIDRIGHKSFRLWYDPGNIFYYSDGKLDPVDDAATVDGVVVGMSVKDFRAPKEVEITPGTGMVNFPKMMSRLEQGGFTHGPLVVECLDHGDLAHVNAQAVKARRFLETLTGQKA